MQRLWAPWRMEYINQGKAMNVSSVRRQKERKRKIIFFTKVSWPWSFSMFFLIITVISFGPIRHVSEPEALDLDEIEELARVLSLSLQALRKP